MNDSLRPEDVLPRLRGRFGRDYRFVPECASTQRLLAPDAAEGAVVATDHQTEGRGRLGREWRDAPGTSVLLSVALRPPVAPARLPELSLVAARAVADAIAAETGLEPTVKFPNDVLVAGRKVAGILGEASDGRVVLGIGVNVSQTNAELPPDARVPATSLALEAGRPVERAALLATLLERLEQAYDDWVGAESTRR